MNVKQLTICHIFAMFVIFAGCSRQTAHESGTVAAVWKHQANSYSVTLQEGTQLLDKSFCPFYGTYEIILDAPPDGKMWYEADYKESNCWLSKTYTRVVIHIHSINDIGGSGWNHGKFGSGMLEKVE